jgi:uncharacterized protein YgiM (DUF1202 family)
VRTFALLLLSLILAGCTQETPVVTDARESIEVDYVSGPKLEIHKGPDAASPILTSYKNGESVSVLSKKGRWIEVRTSDGSGWAEASGVVAKAEDAMPSDMTSVRFRIPPSAVSNPTAHGELAFEAMVNTDGEVVSVKTVTNTTGSLELERQNRESLLKAKFQPIVVKGQAQTFVYDYRVKY